ncbi:MAG: hypothetical protein KIA66_02285 [Veillonella sp.]|nr:hypothetical protein [Veillonella sp.]
MKTPSLTSKTIDYYCIILRPKETGSALNHKLTEIAKSGDQATKTVFYTSDSTSGSVWVVKPGQVVPFL